MHDYKQVSPVLSGTCSFLLMDPLFDPATQVGNPSFLFLERLFYGGLAIFLFGALSRAIKNGMGHKRKEKKET